MTSETEFAAAVERLRAHADYFCLGPSIQADIRTVLAALRLQDAAPQLLAALREARRAMTNERYMKPRIGMERECELADAAIAAATGEEV